MEAAACGTPSAALRRRRADRVDRRRARPALLAAHARGAGRPAWRALVRDPERRDELGEAAEARARGFTWEHTAEANMTVMDRRGRRRPPRACATPSRESETGKAAGLAARDARQQRDPARLHDPLHAPARRQRLRLAGGARLRVPDPARRRPVGAGGGGPRDDARPAGRRGARLRARCAAGRGGCRAAHRRAGRVASLLREPIAHLIGVPEHPWAAAAILPTGVLWMLLSIQRGALQGLHAYQTARLSR